MKTISRSILGASGTSIIAVLNLDCVFPLDGTICVVANLHLQYLKYMYTHVREVQLITNFIIMV